MAGDRLVVIATEPHTNGFLDRADPSELERARDEQRITVLDARATLSRLIVGDMPDPLRFRNFVAELMDSAPGDFPGSPLRAYGEMVDLLTREGNVDAAIRLEQLWHSVLEESSFSLLCAYRMDSFLGENDSDRLLDVFAAHSHVIPTERVVGLADPQQRMREIALLQQRGRMLESEVLRRQKLEHTLDGALGDLHLLEAQLVASIEREQQARCEALSSDAFQETFLGVLGHDLRNPLNTILVTMRMMARRNEVAPESQARFQRIMASSVRMQRMVEQLFDLAEARTPEGIQISVGEARDLTPLVTNIVGEVRASSPSRTIELAASPCLVHIDAERFEQAVWNLLSYSVGHSDPGSLTRVEVGPHDEKAVVTVRAADQTIDASRLQVLLNSFELGVEPEGGVDGLALGLYLAKRIVVAHGGRIEARSSIEMGTTLEVRLPLA